MLCKRYKSRILKEDDILLCLYSISDNNSFLLFNRDPSGYMLLLPVRSCGKPTLNQGRAVLSDKESCCAGCAQVEHGGVAMPAPPVARIDEASCLHESAAFSKR